MDTGTCSATGTRSTIDMLIKYDQILIDKGFILKHAKLNDIGYDLPVVMSDKLKIDPHQDYYINHKERWFDIPPVGIAEIPCGLAIKIPNNSWGSIKGRSSTAWKKKLMVQEGVIDEGYIGPLFILVQNPNSKPVRIHEFDKLAQLIIIPKSKEVLITSVSELPNTQRGTTGFGSSGR